MKLDFMEKFEEQFYFKTSRYFWHVLTGFAGLALFVGVFIFLWGVLPAMKSGVKKPQFPEPVKVDAAEIQTVLHPQPDSDEKPGNENGGGASGSTAEVVAVGKTMSEAETSYQAALDSLKAVLPPDEFQWENDGYWYYGRWRIRSYGLLHYLDQIYNQIGADDFSLKKQLVDAYVEFLSKFDIDERKRLLGDILEFKKENTNETIKIIRALTIAADLYDSENTLEAIDRLLTFSVRNPRDGFRFVEYTNSIIPKFEPTIRGAILGIFVQSYYDYFDLIQKLEEATNLFLDIQESFASEEQPKALQSYYQLYYSRNQARNARVEQLEAEYQGKVAEADAELAEKKSAKAGYRLLAVKVIGISIVFIAFLALFLVVLSIQRNLKSLRETMPVKT